MYHYIYKTTLLLGDLAGKYYYGKRTTYKKPEEDTDYTGSGNIVKNYFNKYEKVPGVSHIKEIIETNETKEINAEREKEIIGDKWETDPMCLNLVKGGHGGGWFKPGHEVSEETRRKISEAGKGRPSTKKGIPLTEEQKKKVSEGVKQWYEENPEVKIRISESHKGKPSHPWTEESLKKLSESRKGFKMSEEQKQKLSEINKGKPSPMKGKHLSKEAKAKISEAKKGRPGTFKGKHHSEDAKAKMSESAKNTYANGRSVWNKGIPWSEETKAKISETKKGCPGTFKGKHHKKETKEILREQRVGKTLENNPQNVAVVAVDEKGNVFDFLSIGQASSKLKLNRGNIQRRLQKNPDGCQIKNYFFRYKNSVSA